MSIKLNDNPIYRVAQEIIKKTISLEDGKAMVLEKDFWSVAQESDLEIINSYAKDILDESPQDAYVILILNCVLAEKFSYQDILGYAYLYLGWAISKIGNETEKISFYNKAIDLSNKTGNLKLKALVSENLGDHFYFEGNKNKSQKYFTDALEAYDETGETEGLGRVKLNIGTILAETDHKKEAIYYFSQSYEISKNLNNTSLELMALRNLGLAYFGLSLYIESLRYFLLAKEISEKTKDSNTYVIAVEHLATAYKKIENFGEAVIWFEMLWDYSKTSKLDDLEVYSLENLIEINQKIGHVTVLRKYAERLVELLEDRGELGETIEFLGQLGLYFTSVKEYDSAIRLLQKAVNESQKTHDKYKEGLWTGGLGEAHREMGNLEVSLDYYKKSLEIAMQTNSSDLIIWASQNLGVYHRDLEQFETSIEYLELAITTARGNKDSKRENEVLNILAEMYFDYFAERGIRYLDF
jgi:tetratricopeptide (TPR) repeat protein